FFNAPATTDIYTLSLHDALPISQRRQFHGRLGRRHPASSRDRLVAAATAFSISGSIPSAAISTDSAAAVVPFGEVTFCRKVAASDRKSTRLNSSHVEISYAVFCL